MKDISGRIEQLAALLTFYLRRAQAYVRENRVHLFAQARLWLGRAIFWGGGIAVGLAAVVFALATDEASQLFKAGVEAYPWLPFLLTPLATAGLLWLTRNYFAGAQGSGIPQVMAATQRNPECQWPPLVSLRIALGKIVLGVAAVGAGLSFGREGPTVQVGACLMQWIGRFIPAHLRIQRQHLLVAGGAAGIAAAFNTPLAGIVFAIEELSRSIESRMSGLVIAAIVLAGVVAQMWLGNHNYYGSGVVVFGETQELLQTILICALVSGVVWGLFSRMLLLSVRGWSSGIGEFRSRYPYRFALACGLLIAALGWASGGLTWCSGYDETRTLLEAHDSLPWYFGPAKFAATVLAYMTGLPGGVFAPSLAIGAGIGQDLLPWLGGNAFPTTVVVLCMVGFLAAATQAPITAFIIVMEMVNGYSMVMGLMASALIASTVSKLFSRSLYFSIAEHMLAQSGQPPGKH